MVSDVLFIVCVFTLGTGVGFWLKSNGHKPRLTYTPAVERAGRTYIDALRRSGYIVTLPAHFRWEDCFRALVMAAGGDVKASDEEQG